MITPGESRSEVGGPGSEDRDPARLAMDQALAIVAHEMRSPIGVIRNAVDILDRGECIWMMAEPSSVGLTVTVRDAGIGIDAEYLPHVFDPFHQGPAPECETQSGPGIGLALVRWLVELHGGSVMACSEGPGKGSEFVVRLPTARRSAATPAVLALGAPQGQDAPGSIRFGATRPRAELREAEAGSRAIMPALRAIGARSRREAGSCPGR